MVDAHNSVTAARGDQGVVRRVAHAKDVGCLTGRAGGQAGRGGLRSPSQPDDRQRGRGWTVVDGWLRWLGRPSVRREGAPLVLWSQIRRLGKIRAVAAASRPVAATSSGPAPDITPYAVVLALGGGLAAWRKNQTDAEEAAAAAGAAAAAAGGAAAARRAIASAIFASACASPRSRAMRSAPSSFDVLELTVELGVGLQLWSLVEPCSSDAVGSSELLAKGVDLVLGCFTAACDG